MQPAMQIMRQALCKPELFTAPEKQMILIILMILITALLSKKQE